MHVRRWAVSPPQSSQKARVGSPSAIPWATTCTGNSGTQLELEVTELLFDPYVLPTGCVTLYKLLDLSETKMIPKSKVAVAPEVRN